MALPILDGNQSATTLSTILSSGQHIPAHTVVSLGTQAITDMRGAVSGSVVSISNFPATQTIAGTVTANLDSYPTYANGRESLTIDLTAVRGQDSALWLRDGGGNVPISGTVTIGNSVTIGSLPAISGTVTANPTGTQTIAGTVTANVPFASTTATFPSQLVALGFQDALNTGNIVPVTNDAEAGLPAFVRNISVDGNPNTVFPNWLEGINPPKDVPISGTVTANTFALQGTAVTTSNFTSTTASTVLANFNATREVLTIFNEGAGNLHICAGATCTTIAYQVRLSAGDYYEVPNHQTTITHSAVFATAGTARVTQVS